MTEEQLSRSKLLKRAGAGAVVLGAGSLISAAPALAGKASTKCATVAHNGADSACGVCAGQVDCGNGCFCVIDVKGCCWCHQPTTCDRPCNSKKQCPAGWDCAYTCCGPTPVCVPPCGVLGASGTGTGQGWTSHG